MFVKTVEFLLFNNLYYEIDEKVTKYCYPSVGPKSEVYKTQIFASTTYYVRTPRIMVSY